MEISHVELLGADPTLAPSHWPNSNWSGANLSTLHMLGSSLQVLQDTIFDGGIQKGHLEMTSSASKMTEETPEYCNTIQFVLNTVVIGLLCILGFTGNTVSILVLQKDRHNRVAVFLLQALAVADNSVLLLSFFVLSIVYGLLPLLGYMDYVKDYLVNYIAKWVNPLGYAAQCCVIWITVLLAVNRYVAICRPFTSRQWLTMKSTRIQVAVVVLVSLALNAPRMYYYKSRSSRSLEPPSSTFNSNLSLHNATNFTHNVSSDLNSESFIYYSTASSDWTTTEAPQNESNNTCSSVARDNFLFEVVYLNGIYTSIVLILPLVLTVGFNIPLIRQIQMSKQRMIENSISYRGRQENNITMVMVVVVIVMTICHTPDRVVMVIRLFSKDSEIYCPHALFYAMNMANLLVMTNSSVDFLIYYIFRRRFRTILRNKLCGCCCPVDLDGEKGSLAPGGADSTREYPGTIRDNSDRSLPPAMGNNVVYAPLIALRDKTLRWNSKRKEKRTAMVAASTANGFGSHRNLNQADEIQEEERNGLTVL